jgi:hypothetical protein
VRLLTAILIAPLQPIRYLAKAATSTACRPAAIAGPRRGRENYELSGMKFHHAAATSAATLKDEVGLGG